MPSKKKITRKSSEKTEKLEKKYDDNFSIVFDAIHGARVCNPHLPTVPCVASGEVGSLNIPPCPTATPAASSVLSQ